MHHSFKKNINNLESVTKRMHKIVKGLEIKCIGEWMCKLDMFCLGDEDGEVAGQLFSSISRAFTILFSTVPEGTARMNGFKLQGSRF